MRSKMLRYSSASKPGLIVLSVVEFVDAAIFGQGLCTIFLNVVGRGL